MLIYLADLTHRGPTSELVPYAIGCIRAYLLAQQPEHEVVLFKDPEKLCAACGSLNVLANERHPDVVGFSNYMWNSQLSCAVAREIKRLYGECVLTVMGGPNFPIDRHRRARFLAKSPEIDVYLKGEGEVPFAALVSQWRQGKPPHSVASLEIPGIATWCHDERGFVDSEAFPRVTDLAEVPSPYLNGSLDEFLADPALVPAINCNRGCPFTCTYCNQGMDCHTRIAKYPVERVKAEIDYIGERYQGKTLHIVDNNFGMYPEDVEIAHHLAAWKEKTGWPQYCIVATGKNRKERVIEVAKILTGSMRVAASVQAMDPEILTAIKRTNISREDLQEVALALRGVDAAGAYSEVILGLPGDTAEKHRQAVLDLIDMGFDQIRLHQLFLLPGSEMDTDAQREQHGFKTKHRILQRSFGAYHLFGRKVWAVESEEVVVGNQTMSYQDYLDCRAFALTVALFHNEDSFIEVNHLLRWLGLPYSGFLGFVHAEIMRRQTPPVWWIYRQFLDQAESELFDSRQAIDDTVGSMAFGLRIARGEIGNNLLYNTKGTAHYQSYGDLLACLLGLVTDYLTAKFGEVPPEIEHYLYDLRPYMLAKRGRWGDVAAVEVVSVPRDFVAAESERWWGLPPKLDRSVAHVFQYTDDQRDLWLGQFAKYGRTPVGLGKIVARTPLSKADRKVSYAG